MGDRSTPSRREMMKGAAAAAVALALPASAGAAKEDAKPAASKPSTAPASARLPLGIFTSVYASLRLDEAAERIKADGFSGVVFEYGFKDIRFNPMDPDWDTLKKITRVFEKNGIQIAGLFGYYNVIHPDTAQRAAGEQRMELLIKNWKRFGTPIISTETGTFNAKSQFAEDPRNWTEEGYGACRAAFEKLARSAEKTGAIIAIEAYWRNCIDSAETTARLFKDVDSPSLKLTMDPCNYFRNEQLANMKPMLEDIFKRVGDQTVLAHAKDVKKAANGPDLPAAGRGELDYATYLRLLADLNRPIYLVIEHLGLEDVPRARDYVKGHLAKL